MEQFVIHKIVDLPTVHVGGLAIDLSITNSVVAMMIAGLVVCGFFALSARRQVDLMNGSRVADFMRGAGLRNVAASVVNVPTGVWGDRLGSMVATDFVGVCKGYGGLLVGAGITTQEQFDQTLEGMRGDFASRHGRCYTPFYVVIGQR